VSLDTWWLYLGAVVLIACTPGPNVLYVTTRSIRFGLRASLVGMAGCLLALVLMLIGSVAGLSALLLAVPAAFEILRYAGAAYLVYLGLQMWRTPDDAAEIASVTASPRETSFLAVFRGGFLVATFVAVESAFYLVYALSGRRLAEHLMQGPWRRRFNRASGVIFAGFGIALLRYRP
jgi:threonine/homoserine/homoserine lactone efflux protein